MKIPIFPGKYHQNGGFSWAMLVYRRVIFVEIWDDRMIGKKDGNFPQKILRAEDDHSCFLVAMTSKNSRDGKVWVYQTLKPVCDEGFLIPAASISYC